MLQAQTPRLVLASASSSRRTLLHAAGLQFEVRPADIDETAVKARALADGWTAEAAALRLAQLKAEAVSGERPDALVIGSDQILVCEGQWFDKPGAKARVRAQLEQLAGRRHSLVTAVTVFQEGRPMWDHIAQPQLSMRPLSQTFLDAYVEQEAEAVAGCVGSYRLEGPGIHLFEHVDGEHSAVLGLPLLPLLAFLRRQGVLAA